MATVGLLTAGQMSLAQPAPRIDFRDVDLGSITRSNGFDVTHVDDGQIVIRCDVCDTPVRHLMTIEQQVIYADELQSTRKLTAGDLAFACELSLTTYPDLYHDCDARFLSVNGAVEASQFDISYKPEGASHATSISIVYDDVLIQIESSASNAAIAQMHAVSAKDVITQFIAGIRDD